jgi:hypothetical protein
MRGAGANHTDGQPIGRTGSFVIKSSGPLRHQCLRGRFYLDGQAPPHGEQGALQRGGLAPVARVEQASRLLLMNI